MASMEPVLDPEWSQELSPETRIELRYLNDVVLSKEGTEVEGI